MSKLFNFTLLGISLISLYFYISNLFENKNNNNNNNIISIKNENNEEQTKELEDYIVGVVACEMPALYGNEALKAQAVASRTYAMYKANKNISLLTTTDDQCYIDDEGMKEKWGSDYEKYKSIIESAVNDTKGIVITKSNELFKTFYFSTSNGYTEDSMTVFNETGLTSVETLWDRESNNYEKSITLTYNELKSILGDFKSIKILSRNKTNHIEKVSVDNKEYSGVEFRHLLKLRSTDFEISKNGNNYTFTTYGYGHGVGMSQYGASYLAASGKTYQDILKYYYGEIDFKKI